MLKLAEAISGWRPAESAAREPIVLLEAAWGEIVGSQVAQHSHPARVAGATLFVIARSNAWCHQLSLLEDRVLRAVSARLPSAGIERLRFRVGKLPERSTAPGSAQHRAANRPARARPEAASAAEAFGRFREEVERSNQAKRSEGWKPCVRCRALVAPDAARVCAACTATGNQERAEAVARLLCDAPWLGYGGTAALVSGLKEQEYERVRSQLLSRWWGLLVQALAAKRLSDDGRERLVASSYVLLRSKIPPEEILPATIRNILGDELHDLIYVEQR